MKIVDKTVATKTEFRDISIGDVFYSESSNGVYMKTETAYDDDAFVMANAVNLRLGSMCTFLPDYKVTPLNCECVITNK